MDSREWQPIETAPIDGADVLLHRPGYTALIVAGWFHNGEQGGWASDDNPNEWIRGRPTHWMPLPSPPSRSIHD